MQARADLAMVPSDSSPEPIFDPPGDVRTTPHLQVGYANDKLPMLNQYVRRNKIGVGQHGKVYLCEEVVQRSGDRDRGGGDLVVRQLVAMKSVRRNNPREEQWKLLRRTPLPTSPHLSVGDKLSTTEAKIRREIAIMKKCRHAHVVRLIEVIDDRLRDKIYMVMEYLGGGEVKWKNTDSQPILTVLQSNRIMRDAILGLEYLHFQGIIHRDIKPANLLWTADRSHVKIADFGVSHFSYAQRLAAAGASATADDPTDPILLEDSDLSKRAGTPSFLAPEVVYEHTYGYEPSDPRPEITKAIDIWALGATLYCLLFGEKPFHPDPIINSEFSMYNAICNDDWTVPETMGFDRIPTGGRHPTDEDSEGGMVIHLLDHFLTKDPALRITLAEVKRHPWFLREVQRPDKWLRDTSPHKIEVTSADTETAMTGVRFRWKWGSSLTRHISTLFRQVREAKPYAAASHQGEADNPNATRSAPRMRIKTTDVARERTPRDMPGPSKYTAPPGREKGKKRADSHGDKSQRSKSVERSSSRKTAPKPSLLSTSTASKDGSSDANLVPQMGSSVGSSAQTSPTEGRPKSRFSIYSPSTWHWRSTKNLTTQSQSTSPGGSTPSRRQLSLHSTPQPSSMHSPDTCSPSSHSPVSPVSPDLTISSELLGRGIRRSEEALRGMQFEDISSSGPLTAARRASSWGDNPTDFNEVTSLNSEDHDLDESCILVGAGGVSNESPFRRTASVGLQLGSSPLAQIAYNISHEGYVYPDYEDDLIDDSSTFASARSIDEPVRSRGIAAIHANLGSQYDDFDDDDATTSEDHEGHLSFDTRRRALTPDPPGTS